MMSKTNYSIAVVGLGYVGLPLLVELSKYYKVLGIDNNKKKISNFKIGKDDEGIFNEGKPSNLKKLNFSHDFKKIQNYKIIIICVPTPITSNNKPDLNHIKSATSNIAKNMKKNSLLIYESTVYPGVTEEICVPLIEKISNYKWKTDFNVAFSPERVSPGIKSKNLVNITKIISGDSKKTIETLKKIYGSILKNNIFVAKSIKVAEAAKVLENIQRDVNIALINEISIIFNILKIDTAEVIDAASTKWNFHKYSPGLVGGHCIGVDPYYLLHKAQTEGFYPRLINIARNINNEMPLYIVNSVKKNLNLKKIKYEKARLLYLGLTYKENTSDMRNSKSLVIIDELNESGLNVILHDNLLKKTHLSNYSNHNLHTWNEIKNLKFDVIILASPHDFYLKKGFKFFKSMLNKKGIFYDIKSALKKYVTKDDKNYISI